MNYRAVAKEIATSDVDKALTWLVEQDGETTEPPPGMNEYERMDMGNFLVANGFIQKERSAAGEWTISMSGRKVAEELIAGRRENGWLRRNLVVRAMLVWIDDEQPPSASAFAGELVEDTVVTERENSRALDFLRENKLVTGLAAYGTLMSPKLTSTGIRVKDHENLPDEALNQGGSVSNDHSNNVHVSHSTIGAVNAGDNATQTGNSVSVENSGEIVTKIQDLKKELAAIPGVSTATNEALQKLEEEAQHPQVEKSRLQELYASFTNSIASKLADASWSGVLKAAALVAVAIGL